VRSPRNAQHVRKHFQGCQRERADESVSVGRDGVRAMDLGTRRLKESERDTSELLIFVIRKPNSRCFVTCWLFLYPSRRLFYAVPDPVRRFVRHLTHRRPVALIAHTPLADITFHV